MEFDELKRTWKRQKTDDNLAFSNKEKLMLINNKMISLEKDIKARDRRELIACVLVGLAFGILFFFVTSVWSKLGCIVIVLSAIYVGYRFKIAQPIKANDKHSYNHSLGKHLSKELKYLRRQRDMLRNVARWYIAPICIGLILFTIGANWYLMIKLIYITLVILLGAVIWYLNQQAVVNRFEPLIFEIKNSLDFIETNQK